MENVIVPTQAEAEEALKLVMEYVLAGNSVETRSFSLMLVGKKARKGRNPQTGEDIDIAAKTSLKLTMSPSIKKKIAVLDVA